MRRHNALSAPTGSTSVSYYQEDEGLVLKETQAVVVQLNLANTPWGGFDNDNPADATTEVALLLHEWDVKKKTLVTGSAGMAVRVSKEDAKNIKVGDVLLIKVIVPEKAATPPQGV